MTRSLWRPAFIAAGFLAASALPAGTVGAGEAVPAGRGGMIVAADTGSVSGKIAFKIVPEPATYGLVCAGCLAAITFVRRRKRLSADRRRNRGSF